MIVVLTPPAAVPNELAIVRSLFKAGLQRLHLRKKPELSDAEVATYVQSIDLYRGRVVLHGRADLAAALQLKGAHYTERTRPPPPLPQPPAVGLGLSTSFHSLSQLREDWGPFLSSCFLSPIYDSVSKEGYAAAGFEPVELQETIAATSIPVIALGGITADNVAETRALGFAGAAVIGSVWQADDPVAAWRQLQGGWDAATGLHGMRYTSHETAVLHGLERQQP